MKNKVRIIAAAVLTLFVLFSMSVPSFAADECTITIVNTNEAVSMNTHTYNAYKIFDVTYDADADNYDYTIDSDFVTFFAGLNLAATLGADPDARAYAHVASLEGNDAALQDFGREAYAAAPSLPDGFVVAGSPANEGDPETATITGLAPGYYLVYDLGPADPQNAAAAEKAIANVILKTAKEDVTIDLKASVPTLDKKITSVSDDATNAASDTGSDGVSANLGQHVGFQIDSTVPDLTNYSNYIYKVKDTMDAGLTPDNNAKVTIGTTDVTANEKCHIVYDGQIMTVTIDYDLLKTYAKDTPITITYSAAVNANASVYPAADGTGNQAELEYSNNYTDETITEKTPTSTVKVYRFTLEITKVNAKEEVLQGAEFVLKDNADNYIPVAQDATTGRYSVSDTLAATEANAKVVSDANGKIYIDGLAEGQYTLTETAAPADYNILKNPVDINIVATYDATTGECTGVTGNTATVINKAGGLLPSTGGIGTYIFTIGGAVVMLTVMFVLVSRKKKAEVK